MSPTASSVFAFARCRSCRGLTLISGYSGEHPQRRIEAIAVAPYPLAGDIQVAGVWLSDAPHAVTIIDQAYDFATGELTSRFEFEASGARPASRCSSSAAARSRASSARKSRSRSTRTSTSRLKAIIDGRHVDGRALRYLRDTPGEDKPSCDGAALWESAGALSTCGIAYVTELVGAEAEPDRPPLENRTLTHAATRSRPRRDRPTGCGRSRASIPKVTHLEPDFQAVRQVALARKRGFDALRAANREVWDDLWKGRIKLVGADERWQALADAALFYLISSTHVASPASTSIFGLATWHDYHYYYGHVMWDIETFVVPVLSLLQPHAAESILDYRTRNLAGAASNARLRGRRGLQFPWESAPSSGQECAPMPGSASWHEDHVSLDVARAFAFHADVTGDLEFLREKAWPVLSGVANWITSRVTKTERGYEIRAAMGIAEREEESDNAAFTNMAAVGRSAGRDPARPKSWGEPPIPTGLDIAATHRPPNRRAGDRLARRLRSGRGEGRHARPAHGHLPARVRHGSGSRGRDPQVLPGPAGGLHRQPDAVGALWRLGRLRGRPRSVRAAHGGRLRPVLRRALHADAGIPGGRLPGAAPGRPVLRQPRRVPDRASHRLPGTSTRAGRR